MSKIVDGEEFLDTKEAIKEFGVSKQTFYSNAKKNLRVHHFDGKMTPWYNKNEVIARASGKLIRKAEIAITGMFSDWTAHARSLGYDIQSVDRETVIERLPQELVETFHVSGDKQFLKRSQMSWVEGQPICCWSTWYPAELVGPILPEILDGSFHGVIDYLAQQGYPISEVNDVYSSRVTSFEEQSLFQLLNDEPLIILQRMARTPDKKVVVLYSDMQLLSSWFVVKRTEIVDYWNK